MSCSRLKNHINIIRHCLICQYLQPTYSNISNYLYIFFSVLFLMTLIIIVKQSNSPSVRIHSHFPVKLCNYPNLIFKYSLKVITYYYIFLEFNLIFHLKNALQLYKHIFQTIELGKTNHFFVENINFLCVRIIFIGSKKLWQS